MTTAPHEDRDLIQLRGGRSQLWALRDPVLADREPGVDTEALVMKVGDGHTPWSALQPLTSGTGVQCPDLPNLSAFFRNALIS